MSATHKTAPSRQRLIGGGAMLALAIALAATLTGGTADASAEAQMSQAPLPPPPANGELGFVLTNFAPAIREGMAECPDGLAGTVRENYLETLPIAERNHLLEKAQEPELTRRWQSWLRGPNNTNICTNPENFAPRQQKTVQGKTAPGMNLDGSTGNDAPASGCTHENFTGISGEAGVDNQLYRALGCSRQWRDTHGLAGEMMAGYRNILATGEQTILVWLRGVDNMRDDPSVEIILANSDDRPVLDSKRNFIAGASFTIIDNPRWRNVLQGRIRNGVIETDPADVLLTHRLGYGGSRGEKLEWDMRQARLRLAIGPDGSLSGTLGAYQLPKVITANHLLGGLGVASTAGIDCVAELTTLTRLADGLKDPKTGQCQGISSAFELTGTPAFINDRPDLLPARSAAR